MYQRNMKCVKEDNHRLKETLKEQVAQIVTLESLIKRYKEDKEKTSKLLVESNNEILNYKESEKAINSQRQSIYNELNELGEKYEEQRLLYNEKKEKLSIWKTKFSEETTAMRDQISIIEGEKSVLEKRLHEKDMQHREEYNKNAE